jgi:hypothetical protein
VLDSAILSRSVHRLENQQHRIAIGRVQQRLERTYSNSRSS